MELGGYTCTYEPSQSDNFPVRDVDLDLASFGFMVEFERDDGELVLGWITIHGSNLQRHIRGDDVAVYLSLIWNYVSVLFRGEGIC
ncbi:hypothetical protein BDZ89DRAFT_1152475 [Hymenopellis radicata]|nr:hypothetical protein BDZ89DRAFT_1152475 [Hymenopellis radicata]